MGVRWVERRGVAAGEHGGVDEGVDAGVDGGGDDAPRLIRTPTIHSPAKIAAEYARSWQTCTNCRHIHDYFQMLEPRRATPTETAGTY